MQASGLKKSQLQVYLNRLIALEYVRQYGFANRGFTYRISHWDDYTALRARIKSHLTEQLEVIKNKENGLASCMDRTPDRKPEVPAELEQLKITDVNLAMGSVYVKGTPKTNCRELQLKPEQIMLFHEYLNQVRPELLKDNEREALLIGSRQNPLTAEDITKQVTRSFKGLYAPRKVNCRTIRQSVVSNLLKAGNDLRVVQVFAGHKYPSATEKYKQAQLEELKAAVQKHHPLG